jgi:hypothetical protein
MAMAVGPHHVLIVTKDQGLPDSGAPVTTLNPTALL